MGSGPDAGTYDVTSDKIDSATTAGVTAPVPELASFVMLVMGLILLLGYVRHHKRWER